MTDSRTHYERVRHAYNLGQATQAELHEAARATGQHIVSIDSNPVANTGAPEGYQAPTRQSRLERFRRAFFNGKTPSDDQEISVGSDAPAPLLQGNLREEMQAFRDRIANRPIQVPQQRPSTPSYRGGAA